MDQRRNSPSWIGDRRNSPSWMRKGRNSPSQSPPPLPPRSAKPALIKRSNVRKRAPPRPKRDQFYDCNFGGRTTPSQHLSQMYERSHSLNGGTVVLKDYPGLDPLELCVEKGERVEVVERDYSGWVKARKPRDNSLGWLPEEVLEVSSDKKKMDIGKDDLNNEIELDHVVSPRGSEDVDSGDGTKKLNWLNLKIQNRPNFSNIKGHMPNVVNKSGNVAPTFQSEQQSLDQNSRIDRIRKFFRKKSDQKFGEELTGMVRFTKNEVDFRKKKYVVGQPMKDSVFIESYVSEKLKWKLVIADAAVLPFTLNISPMSGSIKRGEKVQIMVTVVVNHQGVNKDSLVELTLGNVVLNTLFVSVREDRVFGRDPLSLSLITDEAVHLEVPSILVQIRQELERLDGFQQEGIFRISGNNAIVNRVKRKADNNEPLDCSDPYSLAALLKLWFRDLPAPVLSKIDLNSFNPNNSQECMLAAMKLETVELALLEWLIKLMLHTESFLSSNKMSFENLAICIGPNLAILDGLSPNILIEATGKISQFMTALAKEYKRLEQHSRPKSPNQASSWPARVPRNQRVGRPALRSPPSSPNATRIPPALPPRPPSFPPTQPS